MSANSTLRSRSPSPYLKLKSEPQVNSQFETNGVRTRQKTRDISHSRTRSHSAHSYDKDVWPNFKLKTENTFQLYTTQNDAINGALNSKGIDCFNSPSVSHIKANPNYDQKNFHLVNDRYSGLKFPSKVPSIAPLKGLPNKFHLTDSEIFDQNYSDIKISPHVMEFMKHSKKFSDLKLDKTVEDEIWIKNIKKPRLMELKKEMEKVASQSYLLDENQYELLSENKKEILSNVEKEFQVKGSLYQLPVVGEIPMVFQINPLTSISCIVKTDPENVAVDSLISIHWQTSKSTSGTYNYSNWESATRHLEITGNDIKYKKWKQYFAEFLAKAFSEDIPPVTIGIDILHNSYIKEVLDVLQVFGNESMIPSPCYFILIVPEKEMKSSAEAMLKGSPQEDLPNFRVSTKSFAVKVIQGNLADQQVDVIVNSTNRNLNLNVGNISQALLKKAGRKLQKECFEKYPNGIIYPEYAITRGYKLLCKYVIHGALPSNKKQIIIKEFVNDCLTFTENMQLTSIAFPALGTGHLNYKVSEVIQQMNEAIQDFSRNYSETSIKEIRIVLYSMDNELDLFNKMDNTRRGLPKPVMPQETSKENLKSIKWIQFVNYSCIKENLLLAISALEEHLKQLSLSSIKIPLKDFADVFFFKDLHSEIPNIIQQLDNKKEKFYHFHLSGKDKDKLKSLIFEVKKNIHQEQVNIVQPVSSNVLDYCLLKARQIYPLIRFIVTNSGQNVVIESLDWKLTQESKCFLEVWLGKKIPLPVSKDRFKQNDSLTTINDTVSATSPAATLATQKRFSENYEAAQQYIPTALSTQYPAKKEVFTQNSQDICCFQTENGLLVKVYQGDILNVNVDGIVNAANGYLQHCGGIAQVIINAAGDAVHKEGQFKLNGRTLNDGEVLSTSAGNLKHYKSIIHAVGPIYILRRKDEYYLEKIALAISNSLEEAQNLNFQSLALPAISSAIFGVPINICVKGYYIGILVFCKKNPNSCLKEVHFVDMNNVMVIEIQNFFKSHLIFINEESNSLSNSQSPKNLLKSLSSSEARSSSLSPTQICSICMENMKKPITLKKCRHMFCTDCIKQAFNYSPKCPQCKIPYGIETGNQPPGTMSISVLKFPLSGYQNTDTYHITYQITSPSTKRTVTRNAYLPVNEEGSVVLKMLQLAFERHLIFTVGESTTTVAKNVITWNDIHHKTSINGGKLQCGYPDPTYLQRVTEELASHGITPDDVVNKSIKNIIKTT